MLLSSVDIVLLQFHTLFLVFNIIQIDEYVNIYHSKHVTCLRVTLY